MYPRLQVGAEWVGSGAQAQAGDGSGGQEGRLGGQGAPTTTTVGNWPVPFPFLPWGPVRQEGSQGEGAVLSPDYYDAESLP